MLNVHFSLCKVTVMLVILSSSINFTAVFGNVIKYQILLKCTTWGQPTGLINLVASYFNFALAPNVFHFVAHLKYSQITYLRSF